MPQMTSQPRPDADARFWRLPAVIAYCQRSRSAIYRDRSFPRPIRIGPNTAVWIAADVFRWCEAREAEAREASKHGA